MFFSNNCQLNREISWFGTIFETDRQTDYIKNILNYQNYHIAARIINTCGFLFCTSNFGQTPDSGYFRIKNSVKIRTSKPREPRGKTILYNPF
jgi:hypothetical protein